jgi:hypothetical protein
MGMVRRVEEKRKTKEKIGRSPDDADALNRGNSQQPELDQETPGRQEEGGPTP